MLEQICKELKKFNIELVSSLKLSQCKIKRPYLLERHGISDGSVTIFAVPYLTPMSAGERKISSYAVSRDYHLFFRMLEEELLPKLEKEYPENRFALFSDHSPIDEIDAAARAGLGVIGKNHLLITERYSSYIFIGELITDAVLPSNAKDAEPCESCGRCADVCPVGTDISHCLSALTQKKGELSEDEQEIIRQSGCAWGCDICQAICPHTQRALKNGTIFTDVDFFKHFTAPMPKSSDIEQMSDEEFRSRAYSWRGRQVITRNLKLIEENDDSGKEKA